MFRTLFQEDTVFGDVTSEIVVPPDMLADARIFSREPCVVAGIEYLKGELENLNLEVRSIPDGSTVKEGEEVMRIHGNARMILAVERSILNILGRLSGVATETRKAVEMVRKINPHIRIAATRKTLWGRLDKMAVSIGGGDTHRWNLGDMVLIKDNHIALVGFEEAMRRARKKSFTKKIEVEVESEEMAVRAAEMGADIIMLDNFTPEEVCKTAKILRKYSVIIEVSGGITLENIVDYAKCDIDIISMGHITHSARSINFSMDVRTIEKI